jgi:type II secretory pathway pseudopilin PulG
MKLVRRLVIALAVMLTVAAPVLAGQKHWGRASTAEEAAAIANKAARERAKRLRTCVTTKAVVGTRTCRIGGPKGWECYAISANWRGSC